MDSKQQELLNLKAEILNDVVPLVQAADFEPAQKFEVLLSAARMSDDPSRFRAAYEVVKGLEDPELKVNAMLDLLDAIDEATAAVLPETDTASQPQPTDIPPAEA